MIERLLGVNFELSGDVHVFGALEHLGIDDVGDDSLILAGQVFVQTAPPDGRGRFRWIFVQTFDSSFRLKSNYTLEPFGRAIV